MGGANALSQALGQGANYYQQGQFMNRMFGGGGSNPYAASMGVNFTAPGVYG
jgi:hypothetical protein